MERNSGSKKKMQNVQFGSVAEMLDFLPETELQITLFLRQLIFDCVPDIAEKLSYNVPFYSRNKGIFFIWPGSISWGTTVRDGVRFGFQQGNLLQEDSGFLDKGGRKQVYWKDFFALQEIDVALLTAYIFEAVLVDDNFVRRKSRAKK